MEIKFKSVTIRDLAQNYQDLNEDGVFGLDNKLDIRPPYQREFVYDDKKREAVIDTITKGYPINVFFWAVKSDGTYEIVDGQQRTISICQYVNGDFAYKDRYFHNLHDDEKEAIYNYELMVYLCEGTDSEKLEWFKTINIAGEQLTPQELRNAVYSGTWLSDAKRYFSKTGCPAYQIGGNYMKGSPIRQDYLETVIKWRSNNNIEDLMAQHQHDPDATDLWNYFRDVIEWVEATFTDYRNEMKGIAWGDLYNKYKNRNYDPDKLKSEIDQLMTDDDVTNKRGIYLYVLDGEEKHLSIRKFNNTQKRTAYEKQNKKCNSCGESITIGNAHADHIIPWSKGGRTVDDNCQVLCITCNTSKGNKS